ncbi:peptide/nickel transport system substrate-binding protein [Leucobacter luti]|uniref:ABC transporter substrate-binding protein n=1 Tax=Leucobacter luti TaxID=340320 RepID=UPI00104776D5|nr:ABC transporter substrate-binding protein [Leucobacter luti]MCW2289185.1 peptide/nickel transport system substrate-binding protein [Leucobacter luti]TCK39750.1 peptide/nickel transport system substrate-binding protein [Leucobacter luti]
MSTTKFLMKALVPLSIAGLLLSGCAGGSGSSGSGGDSAAATTSDTLRANWGGFPESWEPGSQAMEPGYMRVPYETLVLRQKDGTILPYLATEWEFGEGAKSLTLTLRDDVTFQDGTPFNAEAVKTNVEYVRDVVGGQFGGPLASGVDSVEAIDDTHVKFTFSRPFGTFLDLLSQRNLPMASPAAIADGSIKTNPVGTSPWAYDESKSIAGTKMFFGEYAEYWGEKPGFANVELYGIADDTAATAALLSGDLDVTDTELDELPRIEAASNVETFDYPAIRVNLNFFDRGTGGVFEDQQVREALCYAIDGSVIASLSEDRTAETQHFIEGEIGYNPEIVGYDANLKKAKEIWAELGNPEITAEIGAAPFNKQEITVRAEQMSQLPNVNITVQELTAPQYFSTWNAGSYPLGVGNNAQITPADWYGSWFSENAPLNTSKTVSEKLAGLAGKALGSTGTPDADANWQAVMQEISDEALACSHSVNLESIAYNTDTVADVQPAIQVWEQNLIDYRAVKPAA